MFRTTAIAIALLSTVSTARAVPPDPSTLAIPAGDLAKSRQLVQQLGSEEFVEREQAEDALEKMGRLARLALLEGVNTSPNPEIRTRCAALLPKAASLDLKARLDVFLADVDGKYQHDLPGWNQFRAVVAREWSLFGFVVSRDPALDKAARSVFVELIGSPVNKSLILAVAMRPAELSSVVIGRRQELYFEKYGRVAPGFGQGVAVVSTTRKDPTPEDIAALLFAETLAPQSTSRVPRQISISTLILSSNFSSVASRESDDKGRVYQAIAAAWFESRFNPIDQYQGMNLANQLGMPEQAIRLAARLLTNPVSPIQYRGLAASTISRLGNKQHIPLLEGAFEDTGVINNRVVVRGFNGGNAVANQGVQVRDVALAISIQLAGQSPEDYGFSDQQKATDGTAPPGVNYSYTRYYLTDDKRAAAFEQWKAWWARNKGK